MNFLNKISIEIYNILNLLLQNIKNINNVNNNNVNNNNVNNIFLLIFHFLYLFKSLLNFFYIHFDKYSNNIKKYNLNLLYISTDLDNTHYNLLKKYNDLNMIYENITYKKILENAIYKKSNENLKSNIVINHINLELNSIDSIIDSINDTNNYNNSYGKVPYEYVNIGFDNMYKLHIYDSLQCNIPFNLLVYVKSIDQVVIKIGNEHKYKYINSKLYRTYDVKNKINNDRSILCNNNIKELNKKCINGRDCKYYHDIIIGYDDNYHKNRQFSYNPIIYNCITFKDGFYVKENIKKINWYDAINLYQSNLSCILIGCVHSMN